MFAREVNLRASDIPGFKTVLPLGEPTSGPLDRQIEQCDGGPIVDGAAHGVDSPLLQRQRVPVQTVLSAVYLMRSPSTALSYIKAADSRRGLGCIQRDELRRGLARRKVEVSALRSPSPGGPVSGVRVVSCTPALRDCEKNGGVRGFKDRLWFVAGPYVVMLGFVAGPSNEVRTQQTLLPIERSLARLLYDRARAHKP